jgi:hypothetical protein
MRVLVIVLLIEVACGSPQATSDGTTQPNVKPNNSGSKSDGPVDSNETNGQTTPADETSRPDVLMLPSATLHGELCPAIDVSPAPSPQITLPSPAPSPQITLPDPTEMLQPFRICLYGFDPGQAIYTSIQTSDGDVVTAKDVLVSQLNNAGTWGLFIYPEEGIVPDEAYMVTASQGDLAATPVALVVTSSEQRIAIKPPASGLPGTTFSVALAGFDPGQSVSVFLYECESSGVPVTCNFDRELGSVQMDETGQGLFSLPTSSGDPPGRYVVGFGTDVGHGFTLT